MFLELVCRGLVSTNTWSCKDFADSHEFQVRNCFCCLFPPMCSPPLLISSRQLYDNHGFVCIFFSILLSRLAYILFSQVHRDTLNFYLFILWCLCFFFPILQGFQLEMFLIFPTDSSLYIISKFYIFGLLIWVLYFL